jgi:hypothetical protein
VARAYQKHVRRFAVEIVESGDVSGDDWIELIRAIPFAIDIDWMA